MDIPQLKLLAARIRELLKESSCLVGHSQSLDLVAALPGLRNWPEVMAFPDRVTACRLDLAATRRLSFRLRKKFELERSAQELLEGLLPTTNERPALEVWPSGPPAGVFLTTSADAIKALLERYEDATDGAVVYAERVGADHPGAIDLDEHGLWSNGLDRVPSGTLLVLGPIALDQQSWRGAAERLQMACLRAANGQHRVAVLMETQTPEQVFEDARLAVKLECQDPEDDLDTFIAGSVSQDGHLRVHDTPTYAGSKASKAARTIATLEALPADVVAPLRDALASRSAGVLLFGCSEITEHTAIEQVVAALVLTDHAGPAARIKPRDRSTPAKDWLVPDAIKALPFLPSIQSAYAQGYRRMVISTHCTDSEILQAYPDVLFIGASYGHDVASIACRVCGIGPLKPAVVANRLIAALGLLQIATARGPVVASDLTVMPATTSLPSDASYEDVERYIVEHRMLRWEEQLLRLLNSGACSVADVKKAKPRSPEIEMLLSTHDQSSRRAS